MNKLQKLNRELERETRAFELFKAKNHEEKVAVIRKRVIGCPSCHAACQLKNWGFVQEYRYNRPHGCGEGGDHTAKDTNVCHLICPMCSEEIYIYNHNQRDQIVQMIDNEGVNKSEIFATVWDHHEGFPSKQVFPTK